MTLPSSKYASPIFVQRKPSGKLRLLVDLRKIIASDYINNNHTVSTLSDAAQHLAGKKLFCKLHYSKPTTANKGQYNYLLLILLVGRLPTGD